MSAARTAAHTAADAVALARVVDHLGDPGFGPALLDWLAPAMSARLATAFRFDAGMGARVVMTASAGTSPRSRRCCSPCCSAICRDWHCRPRWSRPRGSGRRPRRRWWRGFRCA